MTALDKRCVIFDLGGVLIDWNPRHLYRKLIPDADQMEAFLTTLCSSEWNESLDAGRSWHDAIAELVAREPAQRPLIEAYRQRWPEMMAGSIDATVAIARALKQRNVPLYALTNWSAETFPYAQQRFEFLHWFDGIVVSGVERTVKPSPAIFEILLQRYDIDGNSAVFIDDSLRNVEAARALGIDAHHYSSPAALREHLTRVGLL